MEEHFVLKNLTEHISDIPEDSIVSKTIHDSKYEKSVLFGFASGQKLSEHTASRPAILYFVSGEAEVTLGDEKSTIEAGTWVYLPPKLPHSITALSTLVMLLVLMK